MSLEQRTYWGMKAALQAKDEVAIRAIRAIDAEIYNVKLAPGSNGMSVTPEMELRALTKLINLRRVNVYIYTSQNRPDLAKKEQEELTIIESYLPK
jgi:uncharacterized protein